MAATMKSDMPYSWTPTSASMFVRPSRIVVGAWLLVFDGIAGALRDPEATLDAIERRGLRVEREIGRSVRRLELRSNRELRQISTRAQHPVRWAQDSLGETSRLAESELEHQVERVLIRMGIPTRERLEKLTCEIELLTEKIDDELVRMMAEVENA